MDRSNVSLKVFVPHQNAPPPAPRITIRTLAERCGVSKSTASFAFRPEEDCPLAPATRKHILQTAEQLGYRPDWRGRMLATRRTGAIGLVYAGESPFLSNYYGLLVSELMDRLAGHGYDLMHLKSDASGELLHRKLLARRVDGCFFVAYRAELVRLVDPASTPSVLINGSEVEGVPCVRLADAEAAGTAVEHLLSRGHRRVHYFNDPLRATRHCSVGDRLSGYLAAMSAAGLAGSASSVVAEPAAYAAQLAGQDPADRPTAVLAYDDTRAIDLVLELSRVGVRVPADLSVVGFNDEVISKRVIPPLTTMAFPVEAVADAAAAAMLDRIRLPDRSTEPAAPIPLRLVERESVAPPRGG